MKFERSTSAQRGYGSRWQKARAAYLKAHPLCVMCMEIGRINTATVVDHKTPHRGDQALFWDSANWQSLCKRCHDGAKQEQDRTGHRRGCNSEGIPSDPNHHWSRHRGGT